ncbi:hypothetical protein DB346_17840 [Verrucomicrobia bacterium LW23]|nr:hypothetical protein DB346_17840 [Verrucomicrobia bacterium LW23]
MKRSQCPDTVEFNLNTANHLAAVVGWIVAALILYVLSFGPVIALVEHYQVGREQAEYFYAPIIWAAHNTSMHYPIVWYAGMWGIR